MSLDLQHLEKRFFMRHLPGALSEESRDSVVDDAIASEPFGNLHEKVDEFLADYAPDLHHRMMKAYLFGIGENKLYHVEHNLMDVPMREMPTLHALIRRRNDINVDLMLEDNPSFDEAAHRKENERRFNLWLSEIKEGQLCFIVANSLSMDHYFVVKDLALDIMNSLMPLEIEVSDDLEVLPVERDREHARMRREVNKRVWAVIPSLVSQLDAISSEMYGDSKAVAVSSEIDHRGYLRKNYAFLSFEHTKEVVLDDWEASLDGFKTLDREVLLSQANSTIKDVVKQSVGRIYSGVRQEMSSKVSTPIFTKNKTRRVFLSPSMLEK